MAFVLTRFYYLQLDKKERACVTHADPGLELGLRRSYESQFHPEIGIENSIETTPALKNTVLPFPAVRPAVD